MKFKFNFSLRNVLLFSIPCAVVLIVGAVIIFANLGTSADVYAPEPTPYLEPTRTPTPTPTPEPEPEPDLSPPEGMAISALTGLYIPEEAANRRPFAVVYNNEARAMPQAGLSQAEIIYEIIAEGATTRIIAIFQDFDAEQIGPVRSTRHYFTYFALDNYAIMAHHGGSPMGYDAIRSRSIPAIDGMAYDGTYFWRDAWRRQNRGLEHSSITSAENLIDLAETREIDLQASEDLGMFLFFEEETAPWPQNIANIVRVPHAGGNVTAFEYNPDDGLYYKYIFGNPQLDSNTDEQLTAANVIVQITGISHIPGDTEGRRNAVMVGEGSGFLATRGTYTPITWQKDSIHSPTRWYNADGTPLVINRGTTWISVISGEPIFEDFENSDN